MPQHKLGRAKTDVIYIGIKRYQALAKHAREISYIAEADIRPSTFLQYMIDKFSEETRTQILNELCPENPETKE
jgi:hypothetical protein